VGRRGRVPRCAGGALRERRRWTSRERADVAAQRDVFLLRISRRGQLVQASGLIAGKPKRCVGHDRKRYHIAVARASCPWLEFLRLR